MTVILRCFYEYEGLKTRRLDYRVSLSHDFMTRKGYTMAKLSKDKQAFNEALALAKQEQYSKAEKTLRKYKDASENHEKLYQMVQSKLEADKPKRTKRRRNIIIGTVAAPFIICALMFLIGGIIGRIYVADGTLEIQWWLMCTDVTSDVLIYETDVDLTEAVMDAYFDECQRQAAQVIAVDREEVEHCYWQTQRGRLEQQFEDCLVENDVFIDGNLLGLAVLGAQ